MSPPDARDPRAVSDGPPPLTPPELRWRCDPGALPFDSTDDVEPLHGIAGQEAAVEALRFGLEIDAPGQNIFVSGLRGTGRLTLVQEILHEIRPACPLAPDRLFVHNFEQPDRPRLISLPRGQGRRFKERLDEVITLITRDLAPALSGKGVQARRKALEADAAERIEAVGGPFDQQLREAGLTLVTVQTGQVVQPTLVPVIDGETVGPDEFETLRAEGKISDEQAADLSARRSGRCARRSPSRCASCSPARRARCSPPPPTTSSSPGASRRWGISCPNSSRTWCAACPRARRPTNWWPAATA